MSLKEASSSNKLTKLSKISTNSSRSTSDIAGLYTLYQYLEKKKLFTSTQSSSNLLQTLFSVVNKSFLFYFSMTKLVV